MILAVDVYYEENHAITAGVLFEDWQASTPVKEVVSYIEEIAPYEPGRFYKRELPCILKLIDENDLDIDSIIIDGFVFLGGHGRPGLGKHLYDALNGRVPVVGVAKKPFKNIAPECEVTRGTSHKPLYVTAVGIETDVAIENVRNMHGKYRVPTLLKRVDQVCRGKETSAKRPLSKSALIWPISASGYGLRGTDNNNLYLRRISNGRS